MTLRVLTWNLFHGRARPAAGRPLLVEFAAALAGWEWDVALLQEAPPWWPPLLARAADASDHLAVRTSRNEGLALRRAVARRNPDLLGSGGGGCNAILSRVPVLLASHRRIGLTRWPERRLAQGAALLGERAPWVVNLHASTHPPERRRADLAIARDHALAWAGDAPVILGGDFNDTRPALAGLTVMASHGVDHVLVRGLAADGPAETLDAGPLSDHLPLVVNLRGLGGV